MAKRDYYEVLGVDKNADTNSIKKAYRHLALKYHPDRNPDTPGAEENFKEATEAYEVLKDQDKRARYDQFGHAGVDPSMAGSGGFGGGFGGFDLSDALRAFMRDFGGGSDFSDFFGGGGGRRRGPRGSERGTDLQVRLKLTLEEIADGVKKTIRVKRMDKCDVCNGTGARKSGSVKSCQTCGGAGEVRRVSNSIFGQIVNVTVCPTCHGEGRIITEPCETCRGDGRIRGEKTISVNIPSGVSTGNYITLRDQGDVGRRGGSRGDLIVIIEEIEHDIFVRNDLDILMDLTISFPQAALGDSVEVPTLKGKSKIKIPQSLQSGKILRLKGKGISHVRGSVKGDQLVRVHVYTPEKLTNAERKLINQLAGLDNIAPPVHSGGIFRRMKEAFGH